jgi:hypothetical protein
LFEPSKQQEKKIKTKIASEIHNDSKQKNSILLGKK